MFLNRRVATLGITALLFIVGLGVAFSAKVEATSPPPSYPSGDLFPPANNNTTEGSYTIDPDQSTYSAGTEVTINATGNVISTDEDYIFDYWEGLDPNDFSGGPAGDSTSASNPLTFNISGQESVGPKWKRRFRLVTDVIEGQGGIAPAGGMRLKDSQVTLTPNPAAGYVFDHWSGDLTGNDNPGVFTMDSPKVIYGHYILDTAVLVSLSSTTALSISEGDSAQLQLVASHSNHPELAITLAAQTCSPSADGADYSFPVSVTIPENALTSAPFTISIIEDAAIESDECFEVVLSQITGTNASIDTNADTVQVTILDDDSPPTSEFSASATTVTVGEVIAFSDQSTGNGSIILNWSWDFGDGNSSTSQSPTHGYATAGTYTVALTTTNVNGSDLETKVDYIVVTDVPEADFSASPTSVAVGETVTFTDLTVDNGEPIVSWNWTFGDANTSTLQNPVHSYTSAGTYTVALTATNANGNDTETKVNYITVTDLPEADFVASSTSVVVGENISWTDTSVDNGTSITSWSWDFGDTNTSTAQNPTHSYSAIRTYTVALTVTNSIGNDTETKVDYVTVTDVPEAEFTSSVTEAMVGDVITFTDQSTGNGSSILSRNWDFGDGNTSTAQNPTHSYAAPGDYTVTLTVTNANGNDTEMKIDYITITNLPDAEFSASATNVVVGEVITFTDQSEDNGSSILSHSWTFGDTNSSTVQNPTHSYAAAGTYTVALTVTNANGDDTETKVNYITVTDVPEADFVASATNIAVGQVITWTDLSVDNGSPIASWSWDFGDTNTSAIQNPTHSYSATGTYTVALTVTNANGSDTETKIAYITVTDVPDAAFTASAMNVVVGEVITFTDQSADNGSSILSYSWSFGDANTSTLQNPTHSYAAAGTYTVALIVTNANGSDTETKIDYITVTDAPDAEFSASSIDVAIGEVITFTDLSVDNGKSITLWSWTFGDGVTSTDQNPTHSYSAIGAYAVALTVVNENGDDTETKTAYITVSDTPEAEFTASATTVAIGEVITFTDLSVDNGKAITSWSWDFGDGVTSTDQHPTHSYLAIGAYAVALTVVNENGDDTETKVAYITVTDVPEAEFSASATSVVVGEVVTFTDQSSDNGSTILSHSWTFGDGATSTNQNPTHSYSIVGTYTVTLTVNNANGGDTETKIAYITVTDVPDADFSVSSTDVVVGEAITFSDQSNDNGASITSWNWGFGDGGMSTDQNPIHSYSNVGTYTVTLTVNNANGGNTETKIAYITVSDVPEADFVASSTDVVVDEVITFTDLSVDNGKIITVWSWDFGDGGTSDQQNPTHSFGVIGTYTVVLTVTNDNGNDTETKVGYITVSDVPVADFTASATSAAVGEVITFTDLSVDNGSPIVSWTWDFGDSSTSNIQNPTHSFAAVGVYTLQLTVVNANGNDTESRTGYITITDVPLADFSASATKVAVGEAITFTDLSIDNGAPISAWSWNFGDLGTSSEQNPTHSYAAIGTYAVSLMVTNANGNDTETKTAYITVSDVPSADFIAFDTSVLVGEVVTFTDLSVDNGASITDWSWTFGDGGVSTDQDPTYSYSAVGVYTVELTVSNGNGSDLESKSGYITVTDVPVAEFSASATSVIVGESVTFTDLSVDNGSPIVSWDWTFGDGGASTDQNPTYSYSNEGTYSVSLVVANDNGNDTETKTSYITVTAAPVADFALGFDSVTEPATDSTESIGANLPFSTNQLMTAQYLAVGGRATNTLDYSLPVSGDIDFSANMTTGLFLATIKHDDVDEWSESIDLGLWTLNPGQSSAGLAVVTSDNFSSGDLAAWTSSGTVDAVNHELEMGPPSGATFVHQANANTNTVTYLRYRVADTGASTNEAFVHVRNNNGASFVAVRIRPSDIAVFESTDGNLPGSPDFSHTLGTPHDSNTWYALRVLTIDDEIYVYQGADAANLTLLGSGPTVSGLSITANQQSRIEVASGDFVFDDYRVTSFNSAAIAGPPAFMVFAIDDDDDEPATVGFDLADSVQDEDAGTVTVGLTLSAVSEKNVSVDYSFTNNAASGSDYIATPGTIVIPDGVAIADIEIELIDDGDVEGDEDFDITLSSVVNAQGLGTNPHTFTITDDETPTIEFAAGSSNPTEPASGPLAHPVSVTVTPAWTSPGSVDFTITAGTASQGADYSAAAYTGTLNFAALEGSKTIDLDILGDDLHELAESFTVTISNPNSGILGTTTVHTVTIADDPAEALPVANLAWTTLDVMEGAGPVTFTVAIDKFAGQSVAVDLDATPPPGVTVSDSSVLIPKGQQSSTFTITVAPDSLASDDVLPVSILATSTAGLGTPATMNVSLKDDVSALRAIISSQIEVTETPSGFLITLNGDAETDPGQSVTLWTWDFGTEISPDGTSGQGPKTVQVTSPGDYDFSLHVTQDDLKTNQSFVSVHIAGPPTASFTADPTTGYAPTVATFTDTSQSDDGEITQWLWDFDDGTTVTGPGPHNHVFTADGSYGVTLTVRTAYGSDTATQNIVINAPPPMGTAPEISITGVIGVNPGDKLKAGDPVTIDVDVSNANVDFPAGRVDSLYISLDDVPDAGDFEIDSETSGADLGASGTDTITFGPLNLTDVAPGDYHLIVQLDSGGLVAETDEAGNVEAIAIVVVDPNLTNE